MALIAYKAAVADLAPGSHPVSASILDVWQERAVKFAVAEHSRHRPRLVVEDEISDGGQDIAVTGLAAWSSGFSGVRSVQYPVDDDESEATALDPDDWGLYTKPAGDVLRLASAPTSGEKVRITYTAKHSIDETGTTVQDGDVLAVQSLAAGYYCRMISASYALDGDSTIAADSVDHASRRKEFAALAKAYAAEYYAHVGVTPGKPGPAGATREWDLNSPIGDRLTHPRRGR